MKDSRSILLTAAFWAALGTLASCSSGEPEEKAPVEPAWAYQKEASGGPVSLILRMDRTDASLADRIVLEQELRVDPGFEADFPEYLPEDFEGFSVTDIDAGLAGAPIPGAGSAPAEGAMQTPSVRRKRIVLEPDRSGELAVAPLAVYFRRSGQEEEQSFLTAEIPVHVKPIENATALSLRDMKGIFEAPPRESDPTLLYVALGAGALAFATIAAAVLWKRRPARVVAPPLPHEIAYDRLRRLIALDLVAKGEIERFFVLLSGILRDYIEHRFSVMAPERTTEEFLVEATRDVALSAHRTTLGQFLSLCDEVKFARFQPEETAIQAAFDVTKRFIQETTPHGS